MTETVKAPAVATAQGLRKSDQFGNSIASEDTQPAAATQDLIGKIKAHITAGDKAKKKAEDHYIAAGQYLKTLKNNHTGSWAEWELLLKDKIGIGKSRASDLMQIADGRKTIEQVRTDTAERTAKTRALQSSPLRSGENSESITDDADDESDDADDDDEYVARPAVVLENLRHVLARHRAGAEAVRKVIKASRLGDAARDELRLAVEGLISKWKSVLSTLAPPESSSTAAPEPRFRSGIEVQCKNGAAAASAGATDKTGGDAEAAPSAPADPWVDLDIPEFLRRDRVRQ